MFLKLCIARLLLILLLSGPFVAVYAAEEDDPANLPVADKWALIVGVSKFANPTMNLKYAAKDAADFRDFLVNKCHFAADHVKFLTNESATKDRILDVLGDSWLPRVALPDDLVVIFISSHGSPSNMDLAGVNYLVAYDTNPEKLFTTGIPIQHLADTIKERVHSKRVLIVMDACHSGGASEASKGIVRCGNVDAAAIAQGTGQAVVCSSSKSEASWEAKSQDNGVFTRALIDSFVLKGEKTTLADAFAQLKEKVQRQVAAERGVTQTPVLEASKWKGADLMLMAPPQKPRAVPVLPEEEASTSIATKVNASSNFGDSKAAAAKSTENRIPDISGDFAGSNGLTYHYWQNGRKCGWAMPMLGMTGTCLISEDGKTMDSRWSGFMSGRCSADLELDDAMRVKRIVCDNGTVLTRVDFDSK